MGWFKSASAAQTASRPAPRLNSLEWMGRFIDRMFVVNPSLTMPFVASRAVDAWPMFFDMSPERAAMIVIERDL